MIINNEFWETTIEEIKQGYIYKKESGSFCCLICEKVYEEGDIYSFNDRFLEAKKAIVYHIRECHGSVFEHIIEVDKKYTGLTDHQKSLLSQFNKGISDKDISKITGASPVTVRNQRFSFREKAKQAKIYLALIELMEENYAKQDTVEDRLVKIHNGATMVDERYAITEAEDEKVLSTYFISENPLKLKSFPSKEKRKIVILRKILTQFSSDRKYTEKEVNEVLKAIHADFATTRRYLIEYGFMERTTDCREYWVKK
jgi:hypothetical protein